MSQPKVTVIDEYDGFVIVITSSDGTETRYRFDQEDTREEMVSVFSELGFECSYEESY